MSSRSTLAAPVAREKQHPARRWTEHWPLPLAFVLAVAFWFYLDGQVSIERTYHCRIVTDRSVEPDALEGNDGILHLRVRDDYTISSVRPSREGQESSSTEDPPSLSLVFFGPKSALQALDGRVDFFVDIDPPTAGEQNASSRTTRRFDLRDLRSQGGTLARYLNKMQYDEIQVVLEQSETARFTLVPKSLTLRYPDPQEQWSRRVFLDTLEFTPAVVRLRGPSARLRRLVDSTELFELDVRELARMQKLLLPQGSGRERPRITFSLRLLPRYANEFSVQDEQLLASVEVAPPAWSSGEFELKVIADWSSSHLSPKEFALDRDTITFRIRSFDEQLTRLVKEGGDQWVQRWFRAIADIGRISRETDTSSTEFTTLLRAQFFFLGDESFVQGKHYEIEITSPLSLSRK
ncbi:MAG: hypothetical protein CSA62_06660 [Planctomycetota bacterium]|nr:MAG: hypothetical protein CSA62_06660 [Planctomycetota bacterium]